MRVAARNVDWSERPANLAPFTKKSQTFLTVGREYEVHALSVVDGVLMLQVVDDLKVWPSWDASWLFELVDTSIPSDWICNIFDAGQILVLGPAFLAKDRESFGAMVDLERDQVDRFWKRIKLRSEQ